MKIIDNFLQEDEFKVLQQYLFSETFNWYYNDCIATQKQGIDQFQFVYPFFDIAKPSLNNWYPFLQPLLLKLNPQYILRIKVNCRPRSSQGVLSPFHTDMSLNQQTAIFYLNTNNGYTKFKDDEYDDVPSVANRLLTFHGNLKHAGCSATDVNRRVVLNINYIPSRILT